METKKFTFTDEQKRFMKSKADRLLYSGSVNAGKTYVGCAKAYYLSLKYPNNRGLIVRKDLTSLRETTLLTLLEGDGKNGPIIPPENVLSHNKTEHRIEVATQKEPSTIIYTGLETSKKGDDYPTKVGSSQYGWIFVDEAVELKKEDWLFLESRLRHPVGFKQIFGATNPSHPNHWLYKMFKEDNNADSEVIDANIYDNPFVDEDYLKRLENAYSGPMKERLLKGKWVASSGLVYPNFHPKNHIKGISDDRAFKSIIVGADAGFTNPRALVVIGISGNDRYYILDEFYRTRTDVSDAIEWLKSWQKSNKKRIDGIYHDPSEPSDIEKYNQFFRCNKANNDIISGISKVSKLLEDDRIVISPKCNNLIREFTSYHYSNDGDERPVKEDDHLMDALRYALMGVGNLPSTNRFELFKKGKYNRKRTSRPSKLSIIS